MHVSALADPIHPVIVLYVHVLEPTMPISFVPWTEGQLFMSAADEEALKSKPLAVVKVVDLD